MGFGMLNTALLKHSNHFKLRPLQINSMSPAMRKIRMASTTYWCAGALKQVEILSSLSEISSACLSTASCSSLTSHSVDVNLLLSRQLLIHSCSSCRALCNWKESTTSYLDKTVMHYRVPDIFLTHCSPRCNKVCISLIGLGPSFLPATTDSSNTVEPP